MKIRVIGTGHPSQGGWEITDEAGAPVLVQKLSVDSEGVTLTLLEGLEVALDVEARVPCGKWAHHKVTRGGRTFYFCPGHANTLRYLQDLDFFHFDFDIERLPEGEAVPMCGHCDE